MILGSKSDYGFRSACCTGLAVQFYSLLESAKLAAVEPKLYLHTVVRTALENAGAVILPHDLRA